MLAIAARDRRLGRRRRMRGPAGKGADAPVKAADPGMYKAKQAGRVFRFFAAYRQ